MKLFTPEHEACDLLLTVTSSTLLTSISCRNTYYSLRFGTISKMTLYYSLVSYSYLLKPLLASFWRSIC